MPSIQPLVLPARAVAVTMPAAPTVTNIASVDSLSIEDDMADNVASVSTSVIAPALRATKLSEILSDPVNGSTQPAAARPSAKVRPTRTSQRDEPRQDEPAAATLADLVLAGLPTLHLQVDRPPPGLAPALTVSITLDSDGRIACLYYVLADRKLTAALPYRRPID